MVRSLLHFPASETYDNKSTKIDKPILRKLNLGYIHLPTLSNSLNIQCLQRFDFVQFYSSQKRL